MGNRLTPTRLFNRARRSQFASRAVAVSSQAAIQAQQLAHSLQRLNEMVEELSTQTEGVIRRAGLSPSLHLFPQRTLAMGRQLTSQIRTLQRTIDMLQGMAEREENP